jgi:thiol-disulfide isomerase/thioredoxin
VSIFLSCKPEKEAPILLKTGMWRAVIALQGQQLPFNLELTTDAQGGYDMYIRNAEERLLLDEVSVIDDSVNIGLHIFDATIKAAIDGDSLKGYYIRNYDPGFKFPFFAVQGQSFRFEKSKQQIDIPDFTGKYSVTFWNDSDTTQAVGVFKQEGDSVTGTFLTPTGDYRYLQGNVVDGKMQLSTFDGNHAYLFTATKQNDNKLVGEYFSGKNFKQAWVGEKNDDASLPDAASLTYLKKGFEKIAFKFPDLEGKLVTLNDEKYKNKVVILQLFGTWCPNCMDEIKFLSPWYKENKQRGVEIIGLAYERKDDFGYASGRIKKMIEKLDVSYDLVIAGTNDKDKASETLPQLNKIVAFPTTIFIGKDGKVKKIHTGFSGPGTGTYYEQFVQHFNEIINELLNENLASK